MNNIRKAIRVVAITILVVIACVLSLLNGWYNG
jgi:hypothetical protein